MTLAYIPEIENIVIESCNDLIRQYGFRLEKLEKNHVELLSAKCGIKILACVSPIGEEQLDIDFFDPREKETERKYYSDIFLFHINTRMEPHDTSAAFQDAPRETFDDVIRIALRRFTAHTLKYRQDILNGDFTSWLPKKHLP